MASHPTEVSSLTQEYQSYSNYAFHSQSDRRQCSAFQVFFPGPRQPFCAEPVILMEFVMEAWVVDVRAQPQHK